MKHFRTAAGKWSRRLTDELVFPSVLMQTLYWSIVAKRELSEAVDFLDDVRSYPHLYHHKLWVVTKRMRSRWKWDSGGWSCG